MTPKETIKPAVAVAMRYHFCLNNVDPWEVFSYLNDFAESDKGCQLFASDLLEDDSRFASVYVWEMFEGEEVGDLMNSITALVDDIAQTFSAVEMKEAA